MTRDDILDRVGEMMGDTTTATRTLITPYVNLTLAEMAMMGVLTPGVQQSLSILDGVRTSNVPTTVKQIETITHDATQDNSLLHYLPQHEWLALVEREGDIRGKPLYWTFRKMPLASGTGGVVLFHPVPDANYTLYAYGQANFTELDDDADIAELKEIYLPAIVFGVYRYTARFDNIRDIGDAAAAFAAAIEAIKFDQHGHEDKAGGTDFNDI